LPEGAYAAIDLGAESGRVVLGRLDGGRASVEVVHRFANKPVRLPDGLHWNLLSLFGEALDGLTRAREGAEAPLRGVGVDAWGVDYALLDERGRVLGLPFHYRDLRTAGAIERVHSRVPRDELYAVTGIQTMPINTIFQLAAEEGSPALAAAERIALVPDLFALWLSGELANEATVASTTGLLDARRGTWARELVARLGLPEGPFAGDPVEPGTTLGRLLPHHGAGELAVHAVAAHDTASAFAAAPVRTPHAAILSSGTWSLLGLELAEPVLTTEAAAFNLTNERGVEGTTRLLRNVMGLWLVQECRRSLGMDYAELIRLAEDPRDEVPLFDPDHDALLAPDDMPAEIGKACAATGQAAPETPGGLIRSVLLSLACKYRLVLERLVRVSGRRVDVVHVIGGGARNELLCRLTADITGLPVLAGPVEATALGNVLMQARATGELGSLADLREVAAASADPAVFEPGDRREDADALYRRFLDVTGLAVDEPEPAVA
jgi:rhamnulokinase